MPQKGCISFDSYIKPQRLVGGLVNNSGCISFDSYIKPQQAIYNRYITNVVYLLIPTSNHNWDLVFCIIFEVVYLLIPTSNHNTDCRPQMLQSVVYLLIPTSNHNWGYVV